MSNPETRAASMTRDPHPKAPGTSVGIDEPMIRLLVHTLLCARARRPAARADLQPRHP